MASRERMIPVKVETYASMNSAPNVQKSQSQTEQGQPQTAQGQPQTTQGQPQTAQNQPQSQPAQGAPWGTMTNQGAPAGGAAPSSTNSSAAPAAAGQSSQSRDQPQNAQQQLQTRRPSVGDEIGDKIIGMLDEIEKRVENLRETAALMEQEKESLMEMLNTVQINKDLLHIPQRDKEEIEATTNRLLSRCRTVNVSVSTPRNAEQEKALAVVNVQIDELVKKTREDVETSRQVCKKYLNACNPEQPDGPIDQKFQSMVIECTADDQKKIRRRLEHLLQVIDRADKTISQAT